MASEQENLNELSDTKKDQSWDKNLTSVEGKSKKLPYPKSVFFIISNEFCERFNYYGMRTILVLYLTRQLAYDDDTATVIYHAFTTMVYLFCLLGAVISDSWWGKFKTIMILSIVYALGSAVIALGAIPQLNLPGSTVTFIGLGLIALGSGGIKPCVAAFGGDQFKMPEQIAQMATYFSIFYFSINSGSLISTALTPIFRQDVHCFGELECYPLAFGVPCVLMIISIIIFVLGKRMYKTIPPGGNMVVQVASCISTAISTRGQQKKTNPLPHWLDYAQEKCGRQIVEDTKILLKILVLYIPLPLFWALFDQQGSRWTFQATRMNGDIGFYNIKPDQMQVVNPLLILTFIPLYEAIFYPLLAKVGIKRPLQKLTMGGIFAGIAFFLSAAVENRLEETYPVLPDASEAQLRLFNGFPCNYTGNYDGITKINLGPYGYFEEKHIQVNANKSNVYPYTLQLAGSNVANCPNAITGSYKLTSAEAQSVFLSSATPTEQDSFLEEPNKSRTGDPVVRLLIAANDVKKYILYSQDGIDRYASDSKNRSTFTVPGGVYTIVLNGKEISKQTLNMGSVSTIVFREIGTDVYEQTLHEIAPANSMNMLWLLPQYIVMTLGEVMFSVTGLSFSYAQAPDSMKSVLQACWLLAVAVGNVIVMIIAGARLFKSQVHEFLLFAILMLVDMLIFMVLAYYYKGIKYNKPSDLTIDGNNKGTIVPSAPPAASADNGGHTNEGFTKE